MKKILLTAISLIFILTLNAQFVCSCLPEGIIFTSQESIDNFQTNYPGCTNIEGDVKIWYDPWKGSEITNLNGLSILNSIGGDLQIGNWWSQGFNFGQKLTSLKGLENLTSVEGSLHIFSNPYLASLIGLENLDSIGGNLSIYNNDSLSSLMGLNNLVSAAGSVSIRDNDLLTSLNGLNNISSIAGSLWIVDNAALTGLDGLENIDSETITDLYINNNSTLSTCESTWLCNYLDNPNGSINIYNNAPGCKDLVEVAVICGINLTCLPHGNYYFTCQDDVDKFAENYPSCIDLEGNINIEGEDITNLAGLDQVTSVSGDLNISNNDSMSSLAGLDNIVSVEGWLWIIRNSTLTELAGLEGLSNIGSLCIYSNDELTSLTGLDNLSTVTGKISIGFISPCSITSLSALGNLTSIGGGLSIIHCHALNNLTGLNNITSIGGSLYIGDNGLLNLTELENLTSIGGSLSISSNSFLSSLSGLENIDAASISDVCIRHNDMLSTCAVQSICDYLAAPNGDIRISYNAPGCNSPDEVEEACLSVYLEDNSGLEEEITVYPNPVFDHVNIKGIRNKSQPVLVRIFSSSGNCLDQQQYSTHTSEDMEVRLNMSTYPAGMYFVQLQMGSEVVTEKVVKY